MTKSDPKFTCLNPTFRADIREKLERQFFMKLIGFEIEEIELGYVSGSLIIEEKHLQQNYFVHGGVMASITDIVMGFAAYSLVAKNRGVVTIDLNVSYLNPGIGDRLFAEGRVVKSGNSVIFCEADIYIYNATNPLESRKHTNRAISTMHQIDL